MSDEQLIYCTRKISSIKRGSHKQIQFRSSKHYTVDLFEQKVLKLNFSNYQNYNQINEAYNKFIDKVRSGAMILKFVIKYKKIKTDKVAPMNEKRVKPNSQKWFDGKIADDIKVRHKIQKNQNYTLTKRFLMR